MAIAKLSIDLEARLANLQAGLDKAGLLAERTADRINKRFEAVNGVMSSLGTGLAASLTATGIVAFFRATADGLDALNDLSDATGASVENLSALEDIAVRTGTSMDVAGDAIVKLNKALGDAKPGSDAAAAFKAIGVSVEELKKLDPVQAFQRLAIALSKFADDGNKARIVQEIFGKSLREVAPLLKDMAEAGELNATVTTEQAQAAEKFNKKLFALQKNTTDAARALAGPLIDALNELFDVLQGKGAGQISAVLAVPLQALTVLGANVAFVLKGIGTEIGGIAAQAAAVARLDFSGAARIGEMMREDAAKARAEFDALERRLRSLGDAPQASYSNEGRNYARATPDKKRLPDLPDKPDKSKTTKKPWTLDQWKADLQQEIDRAFIDQIARGREADEKEKERRVESMKDMTTSLLEANKRLTVQLVEDDKARAKALILLDRAELMAKLESLQIYGDAYEQAQNAIEENTALALRGVEEVKKAGDDVGKQLALVFSSAAGQAIAQFKDLKSILKGILADIGQIALKKLVTEPLEKSLSEAFNGVDIATTLFSLFSAKGNAFGPGGVIPFASGGVVGSPTMFGFSGGTGVMGEAGPEAILPLKRGRDGKLGVSGGGVTFAPTIHIDSRTDQAQIGAIVAQAMRISQKEMLTYMRAQGAM